MSEKQKIPPQKKPAKTGDTEQNKTGKRGIEPEEMHRQGGNRVSDQGKHKPQGDQR